VVLELHFIYSTTMEKLSVSELAKCSHRKPGTRQAVGGTLPKWTSNPADNTKH